MELWESLLWESKRQLYNLSLRRKQEYLSQAEIIIDLLKRKLYNIKGLKDQDCIDKYYMHNSISCEWDFFMNTNSLRKR